MLLTSARAIGINPPQKGSKEGYGARPSVDLDESRADLDRLVPTERLSAEGNSAMTAPKPAVPLDDAAYQVTLAEIRDRIAKLSFDHQPIAMIGWNEAIEAALRLIDAELDMAKPPALPPLDEAAWHAGFVSGNLKRDEPCPYPAGSNEAWSWSSGRIEGAQLRPLPKASVHPK
jgi:hypothetical protein